MLNVVKHLANVSCKVPARDPSAATLCQDDTIVEDLNIEQLLYHSLLLLLISYPTVVANACHRSDAGAPRPACVRRGGS